MLVSKWPQSPSKVAFLVRHIEALRNTPKYAIDINSDNNPLDPIVSEAIHLEEEKFDKEFKQLIFKKLTSMKKED